MFLATKIVRDSRENIGAPAKTDFVSIFIDEDVGSKEYDVLLKHEQAHIWLEHNKRRVKDAEIKTWMVATEMEIARNIYDDEDIAIIKAPMSMIKGGFVPDSFPDMPEDILLAEEIYEWLINNKKECAGKQTCDCSDHGSDKDNEEIMSPAEVMKSIEDFKDLLQESKKSKVAEQKALNNLREIKSRKPTLVSEMDSILRKRHERESTFRRPCRRENSDVIMRGRMTFQRPPLVEIFVDRSGSFTPEKTEKAQLALKEILVKYNSSVKNDVWFFGSGKISSADFAGGDTPYHLIIKHIEKTNPKIAVVITDDDNCSDFPKIPENTKILVIPVGSQTTVFSRKTNATEVKI